MAAPSIEPQDLPAIVPDQPGLLGALSAALHGERSRRGSGGGICPAWFPARYVDNPFSLPPGEEKKRTLSLHDALY
jgi:hypothetical protein